MTARKYIILYISFILLSSPMALLPAGDLSSSSNGSGRNDVAQVLMGLIGADRDARQREVNEHIEDSLKDIREQNKAILDALGRGQSAGINQNGAAQAQQQNAQGMSVPASSQAVYTPSLFARFSRGWSNGWQTKSSDTYADHFGKVVSRGFDRGLQNAVNKVAENTLYEVLKGIPFAVKRSTVLMAAYTYKFSFGSHGVTSASLSRISKRVHLLCSPFTVLSAGSLDKKRRLDNIAGQNDLVTESNWHMVQIELVRELEHAIMYLKKALPCYNVALNSYAPEGLRIKMARILQTLSAKDNEQIAFYILRTICYLEKLVEQIKSFHSFDDAQQKHEQTKRWLQWTMDSFKVVSEFIEDDSSSRVRATFPTVSSPNSSNSVQNTELLNAIGMLGNA